jgi:multiple sugar transport system ATP-binding protein
LLNNIAGLIDPSESELLIGDRDITDVHPRDRDIAMVFQSYALYPSMTVARNLTFGSRSARSTARPAKRR